MNTIVKFKIYTPYGECYLINELGQISNGRNGGFSETWKLQGIESVKSNYFIPFSAITPELVKELDLLYKNGNPKYTGRDLDHGTTRVWGNTKYHGIKSISFS